MASINKAEVEKEVAYRPTTIEDRLNKIGDIKDSLSQLRRELNNAEYELKSDLMDKRMGLYLKVDYSRLRRDMMRNRI